MWAEQAAPGDGEERAAPERRSVRPSAMRARVPRWYRAILIVLAAVLFVFAFGNQATRDINAFYHPEAPSISPVWVWLPAGAAMVLLAEALFAFGFRRATRHR